MAKNKDISQLFSNAFARYDQLADGNQQQQTPHQINKVLPKQEDSFAKAHDDKMHPERAGQRARETKVRAEQEYNDFVKSLTYDEISNLKLLAGKPSLVVESKVLKSAVERGEDLGLERLEAYKMVKRELIPDDNLIEFRITGAGRNLLNGLDV